MSEYQGTFKRYEKKYLVTQQQYNALAKAFAARMVPDRFAESTISNIYYDTPDFRLIRRSLDRPAYKEKLRLRTYRTPAADTEAFVEIKKKYDHIVYKRRIAMTYAEAQRYLDGGTAPEESQISHEIDWFLQFYKGIQPAMCICYDRLALFDKYQPELRVTFDSGIRWRMDDLDLSSGSAGEQLLPHDTCLMEIKIPGTTPLWLARALSENAIFRPTFPNTARRTRPCCARTVRRSSAAKPFTSTKKEKFTVLETIFGSILTAGLTGSAFVICLLVALALGALVAAVYMYKNTYTQSMAVTLALLPAMVQVIILLVNGNLGAGVAVSGAFSLVRFRSAARLGA